MNKQNILIGLLTVVVILLLANFFTWGSSQSGLFGYSHMMGGSMSKNMDRSFIEQMIPHHRGAIDMAALALERSQRTEIKSLATDIIESQQREIDEMQGWYPTWFGTDVPTTSQTMMGGYSMVHMDSMNGNPGALSNAKDFDQEFIRQMIPHHEMAVMMARMLQTSTRRPELQRLADQIISSQTREIEMMRSWIGIWGLE